VHSALRIFQQHLELVPLLSPHYGEWLSWTLQCEQVYLKAFPEGKKKKMKKNEKKKAISKTDVPFNNCWEPGRKKEKGKNESKIKTYSKI
jgi:hypothetical protein